MTDAQSFLPRARVVMMIEAAERAGLTPISVVEFHAFAYLGNVLSPVWDLLPQKRIVLHRRGGPYYPNLQHDVDALIGRGLVGIEGLQHIRDVDGRWRLEGSFFLAERSAADEILGELLAFADEARLSVFYRELAFAFAILSRTERAAALSEDAIYGDDVGDDVLIDFAQWQQANYSENAARFFDRVMPDGKPASAAQKLHLYTHHLKRRLAGE